MAEDKAVLNNVQVFGKRTFLNTSLDTILISWIVERKKNLLFSKKNIFNTGHHQHSLCSSRALKSMVCSAAMLWIRDILYGSADPDPYH